MSDGTLNHLVGTLLQKQAVGKFMTEMDIKPEISDDEILLKLWLPTATTERVFSVNGGIYLSGIRSKIVVWK